MLVSASPKHLAVMLAVLGATYFAEASPYKYVAAYEAPGQEEKLIVLSAGMVIPSDYDGRRLKEIRVDFSNAGVEAATLGSFRNFAVVTTVASEPPTAASVRAADIKPTQKHVALSWQHGVAPSLRMVPVKIVVRGKFDADFLCAHELLLRESSTVDRQLPVGKNADVYLDPSKAPRRALRNKGGIELLYSFCSSKNVDWQTAAKDPRFALPGATDADSLSREHHVALANLLISEGTLKKFQDLGAEIQVGADRPGYPPNVFIDDTLQMNVVRTPKLFDVKVRSGSSMQEPGAVLDQDSVLVLNVDSGAVGECPPALQSPFELRVVDLTEDEKDRKAPAVLTSDFRDGCERDLNVDLSGYLGKKIAIRSIYRLPDGTESVIHSETFRVANLGLITTFPVVTEIVAAATATSAEDVEATSSVPVSVAVGLGKSTPNATWAVTFPWKLSVNTAECMDCAKYFAVYPHISFVGSGESAAPGIAVGAGVSLAEVFHFSWAIEPVQDGRPRNYLLIGLGVQDIAKLFLQH